MTELSKTTPLLDCASLLPEDLEDVFASLNEPSFRAVQCFQALHKRFETSFEDMSNFKVDLRMRLSACSIVPKLKIKQVQKSADGTRKYQFETHTNEVIESVFIPHASQEGRHALCISSQVGCAMG